MLKREILILLVLLKRLLIVFDITKKPSNARANAAVKINY